MMLVQHALPVFLGVAVTAAAHAAQPPRVSTPLVRLQPHAAHAITALGLDAGAYAQLRQATDAVITGFPLGAQQVDLEVSRFDVFAPGARIVLGSAAGDSPLPRPDVLLLRGQVAGVPGSRVFLGLSPHGSNGFVRIGDQQFIIASRPAHEGLPTIVYDPKSLPPGALAESPFTCGTDLLPVPPQTPPQPGGIAGSGGCSPAALIAFDTDWEFTEHFGGDTVASSEYATLLIGAVAEIYQGDVSVSLQISFLRVWADAADPWTQQNIFDQLNEFRSYWIANMQSVDRQTAHFMSTRPLSGAGGVAYLPGLCQGSFAYGLSSHLNGSFPYPLEDHNLQNWDVLVVAHELGHNFGAPHTHSMLPPVDQCAFGQCADAALGTIMSYCHICAPDYMANIILHFHERTLNEAILPYLEFELPCKLVPLLVEITSQPSSQTACPGDVASFSVTVSGPGPFSYQWRKDQVAISGATASTYTIAAAGPADAGSYDVEVSSPCGTLTSDAAQLTVLPSCGGGCPWDCGDHNGGVGILDFLALLATWNVPGPCDFDGSGNVGILDFLALLSHWGTCP